MNTTYLIVKGDGGNYHVYRVKLRPEQITDFLPQFWGVIPIASASNVDDLLTVISCMEAAPDHPDVGKS